MRTLLGTLALVLAGLPAQAADMPSGCAWLCGSWILDTTQSDAPEATVDAALGKSRQPGSSGQPQRHPRDPALRTNAPVEPPGDAPGPGNPRKTRLRTELLALVTPPEELVLSEQEREIIIRPAGGEEQRLFPGEPHSRVDASGTTRIRTTWKKDALVIKESHGHKDQQTESYALQPDGTLLVTRVVERPGLKKLRLRSLYRRGTTQQLESGHEDANRKAPIGGTK